MDSVLDITGLTYLWGKIKAKFATKAELSTVATSGSYNDLSDKPAVDNNKYAGSQSIAGPADKAVSIPFGQADATSTSSAFTATVAGITELRDGVCVYLRNGIVTSASGCTLNINGLGAKPIYYTMAAAGAVTTHWNINHTSLFVYNSSRVTGGCWDLFFGYYSDANTVGYDIRDYYLSRTIKTATQRYQIMLSCWDGTLLPIYSGAYTTGTSKTLTTEKFNPLGQIYYYGGTTTYSAGDTLPNAYLWSQSTYNLIDIRYSFNTGSTLTAKNDIYLVCVPQNDGSAVLHTTPLAYTLPSTENGLLYKRLGKAYDTYRIILEQDKPVYYYKDGVIKLWTNDYTLSLASVATLDDLNTRGLIIDEYHDETYTNTPTDSGTTTSTTGTMCYFEYGSISFMLKVGNNYYSQFPNYPNSSRYSRSSDAFFFISGAEGTPWQFRYSDGVLAPIMSNDGVMEDYAQMVSLLTINSLVGVVSRSAYNALTPTEQASKIYFIYED